ncbi:response regulator transcription factor [Halarcobacter ebronensis]|uniref:NAD(P)H-flavin oxidoreductase n=1 Tax=Halarcobacter ebronensis TaxID=1462615 RepID=A0A4Q1AX04_9BACT|nr:response regulator transcription factor [Halarcobacter ebronensis]QKF82593.1 two-component system response regulator [Halarcobacter ebronensis]RXK07396.1 NAD(P)H-flavin oxidoreductase [Halarcobacter ebronensis]
MKSNSRLDILSDKKVLCADDNEGILKEIIEILELFFKDVVGVNNGERALDEAKNNLYDVMIFDISMPNMDGLEAIKKIRKFNKKVPIIILSAHTDQEYLWRAVDLKITKYLTKPFIKEEILDALELVALELVDYNPTLSLNEHCFYDFSKKQLENENRVIPLSKSESRLLEYFFNNLNQVITYDLILDYMWDYDKPSKEAVKAIVKELRKKIGGDVIKNIYGLGYKCEI